MIDLHLFRCSRELQFAAADAVAELCRLSAKFLNKTQCREIVAGLLAQDAKVRTTDKKKSIILFFVSSQTLVWPL